MFLATPLIPSCFWIEGRLADWINKTGWLGPAGSECGWYGVTCNSDQTSVIGLDLHANGLTGNIPFKIGLLTNLQTLILAGNDIGFIPDEIGMLANLHDLDLDENTGSPNMPSALSLASQLQHLVISGIGLSGSIPPELGTLRQLQVLRLINYGHYHYWPRLSGGIPPELGNLKNLRGLDISYNRLTGDVPPSLGDLTNLVTLALHQNRLTGSIPSSLGKMKSLSTLYLGVNELSGSLPTELGNLHNLTPLAVNDNRLSGSIPASFDHLTKLSWARLNGNMLSGSIPKSLDQLTGCMWDLAYNALYTGDPGLATYLGDKAYGWDKTQTVAPSGLFAVLQPDSSTLISWQPIPFAGYGGRYEIWTGAASGGPYALAGSTADKTSSSLLLANLSPGTYVVVRTVTDPHDYNVNQVVSDFSPEVSVGLPTTSMDAMLTATGAALSTTLGSTGTTQSGFATVNLKPDTAAYGTAVFSYRQNGVIVGEAGVPASSPTTSARLFVDYRTGAAIPGSAGSVDVYSGFALVNRGDGPATLTFTMRDSAAQLNGSGTGTLAKDAHVAKYVHQLSDIVPGFELPPSFPRETGFGTLDIAGNQPFSVVALRLTINQRGETLLTSTPVVDFARLPAATPVYFPQLADGGGYSTSIILLNTSSSLETGSLKIFSDYGSALQVHPLDGSPGSSFNYSIVPGGAYIFQTNASPENVSVGWVELIPDNGTPTPAGAGIFHYSPGGMLITEAGVPSTIPTTHARIFVDLSGGHDPGLALGNPGDAPLNITLTAFQMDGTNQIGRTRWPVSLVSKGHIAAFADQFFCCLPADFQGVLDVASVAPFAAVTIRSLTNSRNDFLMTTFPVADLTRPAPFPILFPQIADGGGFRKEFILLSVGQSSRATIGFYGDDGAPPAIGH